MGSDRASIRTHENGKHHQTQLVEFQKRKRQETLRAEKQQATLEKSIAQMNAAAASSISQDYGLFGTATTARGVSVFPYTYNAPTAAAAAVPTTTSSYIQNKSVADTTKSSNTKKDWELRKKQRQEEEDEKRRKRRSGQEEGDKSDNEREDTSKKRDFMFLMMEVPPGSRG
jgi:hypothetical protein